VRFGLATSSYLDLFHGLSAQAREIENLALDRHSAAQPGAAEVQKLLDHPRHSIRAPHDRVDDSSVLRRRRVGLILEHLAPHHDC
jgi:hypothetical protein